MTTKDKFTTKRGWLTLYSLACGYIETNEGWKDRRVVCMSLNNGEMNTYEVLGYDVSERINFREVVEGLPAARKLFLDCLAKRGADRHINQRREA